MRGLDALKALWANEFMITEKCRAADQHFKDVSDDTGTNQLWMRQPEAPPIAIVEKDVSEFDLSADEFHGGNILN